MSTFKINKLIGPVITISVIAFLCSCSFFDKHPIEYADAEITSVSHHSDTSVLVNVDVYKNSTAYNCSFSIAIDTIENSYIYLLSVKISNECELKENYEFVVGGLKKDTPYFFQLFSGGTFDLGGPNYNASKPIGKKWQYTIQ